MTRDTKTYIELAAGGRQNAPAGKTAITHEPARRGHDYSSGPWKYEPVKQEQPWLTGWDAFWLCMICGAAMISIVAGFHYFTGIDAGVIYD